MIENLPLDIGSAGLVACLLGGILLTVQDRREKRLKARIASVRARATGSAAPDRAKKPLATKIISALGNGIMRSGLLSRQTMAELERTLERGGYRGRNGLSLFIGSKILLFFILPLLAALVLNDIRIRPVLHLVGIVGSAIIGLLAPDMVISRMRENYLKQVEKGLADGLDMMVICAEAGLALEPAIRRVSVEIAHAHPKLAEEFATVSSELQILADSRVALTNMGTRTGLASLKRLGGTLVQTIQYGTPLAVALRTLATELRQETLTRFEEQAARLPVLLTIPMIVFILPCVFLVVGGPIAVQVVRIMKH